MGADQSSQRGGPKLQDGAAPKTCYYEVLGIERQATDDEIKRAYRKKALELHPDRNYGDVENATIKFAEVQSAYEVLSDPQERAWYDSHRESVLRGDGSGLSEEDQFEHNVHLASAGDIVALISRFNPRIPFTDDSNGFYGILQDTFEKLASEEHAACDWGGLEPVLYPAFGGSKEDYEDVVKPFYRAWINFSTKKTFSWRDAYKSSDAPDRATRRLIDKENKRLRDEGIREFNDAVRALVAFVRKRDPRFLPNTQSEADRQKILRDAAAAQAAKSRAANQAKLDLHVVPDWAKSKPPEEDADFPDSSESEVEHIECVVCGKTFKSEKQYETHERSKKHLKAVQQLQKEMRRDNSRLHLDELSENSSGTPKEDLGELGSVRSGANDSEELSLSANIANETTEKLVEGQDLTNSNPRQEETSEQAQNSQRDSDSDSPELDYDYAPRQDVQNRLADLSRPNTDQVEDFPLTAAAISLSDNDSNQLPKLGKAKAKRAKKAARHEEELQDTDEFKCVACNNTFPSKTKLFIHIKELNHAQPMPKASRGKNKKR